MTPPSSIISYAGPPIDDIDVAASLPEDIHSALEATNGWITAEGGLHVRGACLTPEWHSLGSAWKGSYALHHLFSSVTEDDIPLAEDCFGDQFLVRDGRVFKLSAETDEVENLDISWTGFLDLVNTAPIEFLALQPLAHFLAGGGILEPWELLSVYPPFATREAQESIVSLKPIPNLERRLFLADFARQIANVTDGEQVKIVIR